MRYTAKLKQAARPDLIHGRARLSLGYIAQLVVEHLLQSDMGYREYLLNDQNADAEDASSSSEGAKKAAPVTG